MQKRSLVALGRSAAFAIGCALSVSSCSLEPADPRVPTRASRPNILFVFTDDHATRAISAYGSVINATPHIDRLASEGMIFTNCFATNAICAPSRAVILTGKHSHVNGQLTNRETFDPTQETFVKLLRRAGYETAIIGKWHLKSEPRGFDHWEVLRGQGAYYNPTLANATGEKKYEGYSTDIVTTRSIEWLANERDPSKPFFLMCQHKAPHRNFMPGPAHLTKYDDVEIPEPPTLFDDHRGLGEAARTQLMSIAKDLNEKDLKLTEPRGLTQAQLARWNAAYAAKNAAFRAAKLSGSELVRWKYQRFIKDYLRCVASVDDNLGRLLDWLDASGLARDTVVVYSSDQGFFLGEHGWYDKRFMYEESMRMPLIVRWPGFVRPGTRDGHLVQNLDFAESFLEMGNVAVPASMQGRSLVPLLGGRRTGDWRESIYYHYYAYPAWHAVRRHYGVRTDRYKLIRYYTLGESELFDLARDPLERQSVWASPAYADVRRELEVELARLRAVYAVPPDRRPLTGKIPR